MLRVRSLLLSVAFTLAALTGCRGERPMVTRVWLLDTSASGGGDGPVAKAFTVGGETRQAVRLVPGSSVSYRLSVAGRLRFAVAAQARSTGAPLRLDVDVSAPNAAAGNRVATLSAETDTEWRSFTVDLPEATNQQVTFAVSASAESPGAVAVLLADPVIEQPGTAMDHPLVVVVLIDTFRADHTSLLGYDRRTTPELEALSRDAVTFLQAYTPAPWTRPAVTSLLTSLDPEEHRVIGRMDSLPNQIVTWPEVARHEGFQTVAVSTNPNVLPVWGLDQGFGRFVDLDAHAWENNSDASRVFAVAEHMLDDEALPLFLYLHVNDPHTPYDPPAEAARQLWPDYSPTSAGRDLEWNDSEDVVRAALQRYDGEIRHADEALGWFIGRLRARHLYERALIVVVGDHGEEFKDHGGTHHGRTLYEELVHVPLVIKLGDGRSNGRRIAGLVSLMDVLPTVADSARWKAPPGISGRSLTRLVDGAESGRDALVAMTRMDTIRAYALITDGHKLIDRIRPPAEPLLFDLRADPAEQRPLVDAPGRDDLRRALELRLAARQGGWHVRTCGGGSSQHIMLEIEGVQGDVNAVDLEPDDRIDTVTTAGTVRLESIVDPVTRPRERGRSNLVARDQDEIWFRAQEPILRLVAPEKAPVEVRLGREQTPVSERVIPLDPARWTTPSTAAPECPTIRKPVILAWYVAPPPAAETAEPDPAVRERLRALGYLQ